MKANRLDEFGFHGWIGSEPHGSNPHNSGSSAAVGTSGRDRVYSAEVVELIQKVLVALHNSIFYEDTIIIYTSDHGGLFQKWYQAYEEAIHEPLVVHNPKLIPQSRSIDMLTSHVDILPTILGLAGINLKKSLEVLRNV